MRSIDSVAGEIARLLPVTGGGGAAATPVEEPSALYRLAARRTLLLLGGADSELSRALRTVLLHRDGDLDACEALIAEMLGTREQWSRLTPARAEDLSDEALDRKVRPQLDRALETAICSALTHLTHLLSAGFLDRLSAAAALMAERPGHEPSSPLRSCVGRSSAPEAIAAHLDQWRALAHLLVTPSQGTWRKRLSANHLRFTLTPGDRLRLKDLIGEIQEDDDILSAVCAISNLPPPQYPDDQWTVAKALFRVLHRALAELKNVFAETGECDFAEPASLAIAALRQPDGVRAYQTALGSELRHLLVDEMQDTSTSQYELLELLTAGWTGSAHTLFLVGDPKQSIYLFRQARVERFVQTMRDQRLGALTVNSIRLSANFRSQAGLVTAFNQSFGHIFPAESAPADEIVYTPAHATRAAGPHLAGVAGQQWHAAVASGAGLEDRQTSRRRIVRANASRMRDIVVQWRNKPLPAGREKPWSIAVLVASRRELKPIVAALKRSDGAGPIPFRAVNVDPLREQPEVLDLLALTRALRHPADRVAWWAVLHAPWCGLGLADLHRLAGQDDSALAQRSVLDLLRERRNLLEPASIPRLEHVWPILARAVAQTGRVPVPELIDRTWRALRGDSYLTEEALANTRQFFALIERQHQETGELSLSLLESRLDRLFAAPGQTANAVELMTIHGAKGLEWDVVLIPELERRAPVQRSRLLEWEELSGGDQASANVVLAPIAGKGEESSALNRWLRSIRAGRLAAERRRQFYVACTRAKEELHLFGTANRSESKGLKPNSASLLAAAWPAAAEHFVAAGEPAPVELVPSLRQSPAAHGDLSESFAIAASADEPVSRATIERLPLSVLEEAAREDSRTDLDRSPAQSRAVFTRPEGSFTARSLGNAVHAFLELAATHLHAPGSSLARVEREVAAWQPRIRAVLRADGLAPTQTGRLADSVLFALRNTLHDATGQWLLGARVDARSEYALSLAQGVVPRVRLDRIFRAGATPLATGEDHLWIIDYKTASHAPAGLDAWLETERARYAGQLETYAQAVPSQQVNVGLWYPMLARLIWWKP